MKVLHLVPFFFGSEGSETDRCWRLGLETCGTCAAKEVVEIRKIDNPQQVAGFLLVSLTYP